MKRLIISFVLFTLLAIFFPLLMKIWGIKDAGLFWGWEVGAILQTLITFMAFSSRHRIPLVNNTLKQWLHTVVTVIITVALVSFFIMKLVEPRSTLVPASSSSDRFELLSFLLRDALTMWPLFTYLAFNLFLYIYICRRNQAHVEHAEEYLSTLKRTIYMIDLPCLLPYVVVVIFALMHKGETAFDWSTYVSGAGSLLLLTSNMLSESSLVLGDRM